jgi:hypothetical protein
MTSVLSFISHHTRKGTISRLKTVILVWALRDLALFDGFAAFLEQIARELKEQSPQQQRVHFTVQIYLTAGRGNAADGASGVGLEEGGKAMHKQLGGDMRLVDGG